MANIEQKVETLLKPKIEELGYELYDVEYVKEGKNYFLMVVICLSFSNRRQNDPICAT